MDGIVYCKGKEKIEIRGSSKRNVSVPSDGQSKLSSWSRMLQ